MKRRIGFGVMMMFAFAGCATDQQHANFPNPSTSANVYVAPHARSVRKVAILPFKAATALIGESLSDLWVTEVLRSHRYEVVERSQWAHVLSETELALAGLSAAKAAAAGAMVGADGVIIGTIDENTMVASRGKTLPVVRILI